MRLIRGWIRLWLWNVCPKCNHDAPELYDCPVCEYYTYLPRYRSEQTIAIQQNIWIRFKQFLK